MKIFCNSKDAGRLALPRLPPHSGRGHQRRPGVPPDLRGALLRLSRLVHQQEQPRRAQLLYPRGEG